MGGILAGYFAGYTFIDEVGGWRSMYGVAAPLALLLGVGMVRGRGRQRVRSIRGAVQQQQQRHTLATAACPAACSNILLAGACLGEACSSTPEPTVGVNTWHAPPA